MKKSKDQSIKAQTPLVDLVVDEKQHQLLKDLSSTMTDVTLNERQICDFELLSTGVFSPLKGFMKQIDYESVLDRMRLESGELWPIPICLDISRRKAANVELGQSVALRDEEGFLLGIMNVEDKWELDIEKEALAIYNTIDATHPSVNYLKHTSGKCYIGGEIQTLNLPIHSDFKQIRNTPAEVRKMFAKLGWKRIVSFHTRQPSIHR
jgi:sulfate adenylyltransferase